MTRLRTGYYKLIEALNIELRKQGFAYVTYGNYTDIDMDNQSIFPYAHIIIPSGNTRSIMSIITPRIIVADLVDITKNYNPSPDEVFDPTNLLDVHQDLLARAQAAFLRVDTYKDVDLIYPYNWDGFKEKFTNLLAGWTFTVGFEITNADNGIC